MSPRAQNEWRQTRNCGARVVSLCAAALVVAALALLALNARYRLLAPGMPEAFVLYPPEPPRPESPRSEANMRPPPIPALPSAPPAEIAPPLQITELPLIADPQWVRRPPNPERYYPREAFLRGIEGRVELDCIVDEQGQLSCELISETPPNMGFGEAALRLSRDCVMAPVLVNGAAVRARYRLLTPFSIGN